MNTQKYLGLFAIICAIGISNIPNVDAKICIFNCQPIDFCDDILIDPFCTIFELVPECVELNIWGGCAKYKGQ